MEFLVVFGVLALSVYAGKLDPDVFAGLMTTFVGNYIDVGKHAPLACQSRGECFLIVQAT